MNPQNIKTAYDLKYAVQQAGVLPYFFDRKTMKFFGDTMRNYGVRRVTINTYTEDNVACFELYRRHPVKCGLTASTYFDCATLEKRFPKRD